GRTARSPRRTPAALRRAPDAADGRPRRGRPRPRGSPPFARAPVSSRCLDLRPPGGRVEGVRKRRQELPDPVEEEPGGQDPEENLSGQERGPERSPSAGPARRGQASETGGADRPIAVLDHALAAEEPAALGAARGRLPAPMDRAARPGQL